MAENYSLHMPASKAAAWWGPTLCEEDSGTGRTFVYNARVGGRWEVGLRLYFQVLLSLFEVKIFVPLYAQLGSFMITVLGLNQISKLSELGTRFPTLLSILGSEKKNILVYQ